METQEEVLNTGPLTSRVEDKNWKTRMGAYTEVKKLMTNGLADDPIFDEYADRMPKMATDSNAGALDAGLECVLVFADLAPLSCIRQHAHAICAGVVEKALGANKVTSVQTGRAIILKLMEVDDPSTCTAILLSKLTDKKPKVPPTCLALLKEGIQAFGVRAFPVRDVISGLGPVFSGNNSAARDAAMALMVEMTRWIGQAPFNSVVENLRSAQKTDFEKLCLEVGSEKPTPSVWLRKERPSVSALAAASGDTKQPSSSSSSSGPSSADASASMDAREYVEEVDLLRRLKATNYHELIAEEKWSEQLKGLQLIIETIGPTPKIKPGTDTHEILDTCKVFLRQGHVQLQVSSLRIIALLADGLRGEFGMAVRPLTQAIIMKCKEKRLVADVTLALQNILKHCLGFESLLDESVEHIKNKKTPPHGRVCLMEFVTKSLQECPERISNDCLKPLAETFVSVCEDSDPKVRDSNTIALAQLAVVVRVRGRPAAEAHRTLMALETSAPRVFKKMQISVESIMAGGGPAVSSAASAPTAAVAPRQKTAPPAPAEEKAAPPTRPATAAPLKRAVGSKPAAKKKGVTSSASTSGAAGANSATSTAEDDREVDDLAMSGEEAAAALEELGVPSWGSVMALMASSKWQDKVEAYSTIEAYVKTNAVGARASAALVALVKDQNPGLKVTNVNVFKAVLQVVCAAAECPGSGDFSRSAAMEVLRAWGDKIGDRKTKEAMEGLLTALLEAISPGFVLKNMSRVLDKVKAPAAHQYYLEWLKRSVTDFGTAIFPVQSVCALCHAEMENRSAPVRTAAVEVLGVFYNHLGPRFMSVAFTDDMKPALKSLLEAEFEKVGFDPSATNKVSRAVKGQVAAAAGGAIPRVDLSKALDASVIADLGQTNGKNSWETRKSAMEAIIQACERSGHFIEGNSSAKGIMKTLKERLNDTQANLKPLAATTMGHMLRSFEAESSVKILRIISGPLLAGVSDNKKAMRDATIAALQMIVTYGCQGDGSRPDANLVASLVPALAEAALNPVGRTELLSFFLVQVESDSVLKSDWSEVLTALVTSLQDRTQSSRTAAEQLFCALIAKNYVTRADAAKSFRDLAPATMRSLQAAMDRIMSTPSLAGATAASTQAVPAPVAATAPEPEVKPAASRNAPAAVIVGKNSSRHLKPSASSEDAPAGGAASSSAADAPSASFPLKKTSKTKRLDDFYKQNWPQPPEDPGATEMSTLKGTWESILAPELFEVIFEDSKGGLVNQDSVMGAMAELMSMLSGDSVGATSGLPYGTAVSDAVIQHTDLILRWAALALCLRESSSGLLNVLLLISKVFDAIYHVGGQLHEGEIAVILPALIERSGHRSERHKAAFKSVISSARRVVAPNRLCQLLVQGLKCKNKKTRVICIEIIDLIIAESGPSVLGKQGIRDVAATFDTRDLDVGVRNAALDFCHTLYTCVGSDKDKLMKLLGSVSEKAVPMISHRIKEKEKQRSTEAAPTGPAPSAAPSERPTVESSQPAQAARPAAEVPFSQRLESIEPKLTLTPPDTMRQGGFAMLEDEDDVDAPFRLEMTPPESQVDNTSPAAARGTWSTVQSPSRMTAASNRRISLDGEGDVEPLQPISSATEIGESMLGQVCADIWSKVDALLVSHKRDDKSSSQGEIAQDAKEYLKIAHSILRDEWSSEGPTADDKEVLLRQLPGFLDRVLKCLSYGFTHPLALPFSDGVQALPANSVAANPLSSTMDIGLVSVSLAVLFAMFDRLDFCRGISEMSVSSIIEVGVRHLVDPRLRSSNDEVTRQISKGLNALILKIACAGTIRPGHVMCAIVDNLMLCIPEKMHVKSLPADCAMPLSRLLLKLLREEMARGPGIAFHMPNVDSMRAISVLNTFFNAHPATPPADDTPYCSAKTFLAQLMEALGVAEVQRIAGLLKIPQTSFLCRLINRMSGGVAGAVLEAATDKERAVAVAGVRDDVRERIVGIIDRITASRDKILPIRELHQLLKENPDADVAPYLQALSSAFRKFVIDTLAKLDGEGSARDGDPAASFRMVVDTSLGSTAQSATRAGEDGGDGSEALRILEGLKAKQGISRSNSKNRTLISDKVKGTLSSLSATLSMDPTPGSPLAAAAGGQTVSSGSSVSSTNTMDNDLAARLQRLKKMDQNFKN